MFSFLQDAYLLVDSKNLLYKKSNIFILLILFPHLNFSIGSKRGFRCRWSRGLERSSRVRGRSQGGRGTDRINYILLMESMRSRTWIKRPVVTTTLKLLIVPWKPILISSKVSNSQSMLDTKSLWTMDMKTVSMNISSALKRAPDFNECILPAF
jgi:hypothetical protein